MQEKVVLPDMIFETDYTVVFLVSSLDEVLKPLFARLENGEAIDYWFSWDVIRFAAEDYVVVLEIGWDDAESVALGIPLQAWPYLSLIRRKGIVALVTNFTGLPSSLQPEAEDTTEYEPRTLVIRNAERGMDALADEVANIDEPDRISEYLARILSGETTTTGIYIH